MADDLFESPLVFLSYAKEDRARVSKAFKKLKADNLRPWMDVRNLLPGHEFDTVIRKKIRSCRFFAVFLSSQSLNKRGYVQREIKEALDVVDELPENTIFVIPIRLENCGVPERLSRWHWVDLFLRGGYTRLKKQLIHLLGDDYVSPPTKPVVHARRIPRFESFADAALYELFRAKGSFYWGVLAPGRYVVSDGHFVIVRPSIPKAFYSMRHVELGASKIKAVVPDQTTYRKSGRMLNGYSKDGETALMLKSADGKIVCAVDPRLWSLVELFFPKHVAYLRSPIEPVVVEDSGNLVCLVQPIEPPQLAQPSENTTDLGEDEDEEYYDDPIYADDRKVLEGIPFEKRF